MYKEPFQQVIAQQIKAEGESFLQKFSLRFTETTRAVLQDSDILAHLSSPENITYVSRLLAEQIKEHLFRTIPYFEMDNFTQGILLSVCECLFRDVKRGYPVKEIERSHFQRYRAWLELHSGKRKKNLPASSDALKPVYAEYTAELQVKVLQLNLQEENTPLLDIGCGAQGNLVNYLRGRQIPAFGLDRVADDSESYFIRDYWWNFPLEKEAWGTITAHLSFSSHFLRAHLLGSAFSVRYAKLYLTILESLKKGGCFHYAPSLPFMEQWLPTTTYHVRHTSVNDAFQATIVTRK